MVRFASCHEVHHEAGIFTPIHRIGLGQGSNPNFGSRQGDFFAALCRARGSAPPRRAAAAYGVAYLSTKCLGEVKSSSGRAAMFVAAKTFFVRNLEIGPEIQCIIIVYYDLSTL